MTITFRGKVSINQILQNTSIDSSQVLLKLVRSGFDVIPYLDSDQLKFIDKQVALTAIKSIQNSEYLPATFKKIPEAVLDVEIAQAIVDLELRKRKYVVSRDFESFLSYIPVPLRSYEVCSTALAANPNALKHIPQDLIDEKIARAAINWSPFYVRLLPKRVISYEMALDVIKIHPTSLEFLAMKHQTPELLKLALREDPSVIRFISHENITPEVAEYAVKLHTSLLQHLPDHMQTKELLLETLIQRPDMIKAFSGKVAAYGLADNLIENNVHSVFYIPDHLITPKIISNNREAIIGLVKNWKNATKPMVTALSRPSLTLFKVDNQLLEHIEDLDLFNSIARELNIPVQYPWASEEYDLPAP